MTEQTEAEANKLKVLDATGEYKQIWGRDFVTSRFNRKIEFDASDNPIEIWIHDYDSKQTKKLSITWDEGNPIQIKDEFVTIAAWVEKWGSPP